MRRHIARARAISPVILRPVRWFRTCSLVGVPRGTRMSHSSDVSPNHHMYACRCMAALARAAWAATLLLAMPSCSTAGPPPAADFDLAGSAALVRDGKVKDGKELERELNRPERSRIDVDHDGKRDPIQVVEHREGDRRVLEARAIPSSKRKQAPGDVAVPVATFLIEPQGGQARVTARYADTVVVANPAPIVFVAPMTVGTFCYWVLVVDRPIFVGSYGVIVEVIRYEHMKHKKHKKHRGWD
jgi:hypothetical protein